jgi:hypothetical protein
MLELNDQNNQAIVVEDRVFAAASPEESVDCSVGHGAQSLKVVALEHFIWVVLIRHWPYIVFYVVQRHI